MKNHASCHIIADYFLLKLDPLAGDALTNLKLQKLCYYAQGWHLALFGAPLFSEVIEAWAHGPVVPELYQRFKSYKWQAIDPFELVSDPEADLHDEQKEFLDQVWSRYNSFSGKMLEHMTHAEPPWKAAYRPATPQGACQNVISHEAMKAHFGNLLQQQQAS